MARRNFQRRPVKPLPVPEFKDRGENPPGSNLSPQDILNAGIGPLDDSDDPDDVYCALGVPDANHFYEYSELARITSNPEGEPEPLIFKSTPEPPHICERSGIGIGMPRCHYADEDSHVQVNAGVVDKTASVNYYDKVGAGVESFKKFSDGNR